MGPVALARAGVVTTSPPGPLRRVLRLGRQQRRHVLLAVLTGAGAAACSAALLATSGFLLSRAALHPPVLELMVAIVAVRAFGLGRAVLRYLERLAAHDAALRFLGDLRARFFARLEPLAPGGLEPHRSGDLLARAVGDVETLQHLVVRGVVPVLVAAVVGLPAVGVAWAFLPVAGLTLAIGLAVAGAGIPLATLAVTARAGRRQAEARGRLATGVVDLLQGAPELVAAGRFDHHLAAVRASDGELTRLARRDGAVTATVAGAGVLTAGLTMWTTLVVAVPAVRGGTLAGVLVATLAFLALATFEAASPVAEAARRTSTVRAAAVRLFAVTDAVPPVRDPDSPLPLPAGPGVVVLEAASMAYDRGGGRALDGLDLVLRRGRRVAIVGPSGAGKTTVANVLTRFRDLDGGRMTVDGIDVRALDQDDIRRVVGMAAQDAHLFDTTIAENVRLARPEANDDEVAAALARAQAGDWVATLPAGLATRVGERGNRVSGGQRQRIALARVLLADTPVVVLDEPMANLDGAMADALLDDVLAATADRALLLITHRLAGLEPFDEIVVLDRGRAIERGSHQDLLASGGLYRRLWDLEQDAAAVVIAATTETLPSPR